MAGILGDSYAIQSVKPIVVSCDGWSWALAWAQLGVARILCYPLTSLAKRQLSPLIALLKDTVAIEMHTQLQFEKSPIEVVSFHAGTDTHLDAILRYLETAPTETLCLLSGTESTFYHLQRHVPNTFKTATMRHRRLGGLTTARIQVGWSLRGSEIYPGKRTYPLRPVGAFLEPSVRLREWNLVPSARPPVSVECWDATLGSKAKPFSWPPSTRHPWVRTRSVFFKERWIERPITDKEKAQLLDLREDWGNHLINDVWEWNQMESPPLRLLVEFTLSANTCLQSELKLTNPIRKGMHNEECFDWSRTRPALSTAHATESGSLSPVEEAVCFGWHWDSADGIEVSTAARADDAKIDLSLWNVGGDAEGMEEAREIIRNALHSRWTRRLTIEAASFFASQHYSDPLEKERDREALLECIERCRNSTWWEWSDGSRLHFWRWPDVWRHEARDGARACHLKDLPPRLTFPQVPIDDPWTQEKITEKLLKLVRRRPVPLTRSHRSRDSMLPSAET